MFELVSAYEPAGDQPQAIEALVRGIKANKRAQCPLGVTGRASAHFGVFWQVRRLALGGVA